MTEHYTRSFEYNLWANKKFSEVLRTNPFKNDKIQKLISHIGNTQAFWLSKLKEEDTEIDIWEEFDMKESLERLANTSQDWLDYLYNSVDIEESVKYTNSKGDEYESRLADILTHVVNHGTHHRGQVALLLREEDIDPPASDYIFFVRS